MAYRASTLRGLAVIQMVFGALMVVLGTACIFAVHHWSSYISFGLWVGVWVLITGILGYVGARDDAKPNKCLIGCFMGFSITSCVFAGVMFICYCIALAEFARDIRRCKYNDYDYSSYSYWYPCTPSKRYTAEVGAGLGSCLLIFSIVEGFVALASSIYCCNAVCCGATTVGNSVTSNQQVMYLQPQQMYSGGQPGMMVIQPSGAMATVPHGYPVTGQQAVYMPPQPAPIMQQPAGYWVMPSGSSSPGTATMSYAGAGAGATAPNQAQAQEAMKGQERPPPYSYMQTGNAPAAPPSVSASGAAASEDVPGAMAV